MVYSQYSLIAGHLQFLLACQEIQRKPDKSGIFNRLVCVKCQTKPTSFAIRFIWVWLYMQTQSKASLQMAHLTFSHHIYSLRFCLATACFIDPKVEPFGWFFFPWRVKLFPQNARCDQPGPSGSTSGVWDWGLTLFDCALLHFFGCIDFELLFWTCAAACFSALCTFWSLTWGNTLVHFDSLWLFCSVICEILQGDACPTIL